MSMKQNSFLLREEIMEIYKCAIEIAVVGLVGTGLTIARRINNKGNEEAGRGIAGCTIGFIIFFWLLICWG